MSRLRTSILVLGAGMTLAACSATDAEPRAGQARPAVAEGGAEEPGYTVHVELPSNALRGQETLARVHVQPKAPWHMNLDYPAKLRLTAPDGIKLVAPLLHKADAERFDDDALVFSVLFTPEAKGPHTIEAEVDFAVCGDAACGPVTESVQLAVEVGCRDEDTGLC